MTSAAPQGRRFLGIGWKFPLQVTPHGKIAQARAEQRVVESILLILATAPGERPMLPDFGCGIHDLVFAENNASTITLVVHLVREALVKYEAAIKFAPNWAELKEAREAAAKHKS